jgi:hypothetical protein
LPRISAPASSGDGWLASVISMSGCSPRRLRGAARGLARGVDLKQRQPRVIEKGASGRGERDATRATLQQRHANLEFEVADLPAQRRLRGMEPPLGGIGQAAFLGNGNEIAQVAQLHSPLPML